MRHPFEGRFLTLLLSAAVAACDSSAEHGLTAPIAVGVAASADAQAENFSEWSTPVSLGPLVNSAFLDQQPMLTKDGRTLYFSSSRPTDPADAVQDLNIWVAHRACTDSADDACAWNAPQALGEPINGPSLDVAPVLSRDEHQLFFGSQRARDNCLAAPCDRDIWVSYREDVHDDFAWQEPIRIGAALNSAAQELPQSYFEGGEGIPAQLFFTRGLQVTSDLYVSYLTDDGWGPASPITELNTATADARPSVAHNGLELYFWSSRSGTAQIWHATRESATGLWAAPTLVPSPIADEPTQQPFILSHGKTQTLLFNRTTVGGGQDFFMSQRTRGRDGQSEN